jgi:cobalt-zinc-cadmium efflux system membrane fusion protein
VGGLPLRQGRAGRFREERATDGRIAINEDTTTPVFSPYSGRVSRLIAKPGEHVERGAPLFAIEASEFVQGHNDLITAVAGVDKAKSRLALAQMAEKRQRDLQAIRGGAPEGLDRPSPIWCRRRAICAPPRSPWRRCATAAHPRPQRRGDRRSREARSRRRGDHRGGADLRHRHPAQGRARASTSTPAPTTRSTRSATCRPVWLVANVRESDAPKMKVARPVQVTVLAFPGQVFNAKLDYVRPASIPTRAACRCAPQVKNTNLELKPEMFRLLPHRLGRRPLDACGAGRFDRL